MVKTRKRVYKSPEKKAPSKAPPRKQVVEEEESSASSVSSSSSGSSGGSSSESSKKEKPRAEPLLPPKTVTVRKQAAPVKKTAAAVDLGSPAGSVRSVASTSSSRKKPAIRSNSAGPPEVVQRELLEDIEAGGGLTALSASKFGLRDLCDKKPDVFGERGTELREQLRQKVRHWKSLKEEEYQNEVLAPLQVLPHKYRQNSQQKKAPPPPPSTPSTTTNKAASKKSGSKKSTKQKESTVPAHSSPEPTPVPSSLRSAVKLNISETSTLSKDSSTEEAQKMVNLIPLPPDTGTYNLVMLRHLLLMRSLTYFSFCFPGLFGRACEDS